MSNVEFKSVGFIGLGAMGGPMADHLANKLPEQVQIHVFDVSESVVQDICQRHFDRVQKSKSARDVADQSVSVATLYSW